MRSGMWPEDMLLHAGCVKGRAEAERLVSMTGDDAPGLLSRGRGAMVP